MAQPHEPPLNFGLVAPGIYRSGMPGRNSVAYLRRLGLRTLVRLVDGPAYPPAVEEWIAAARVAVIDCRVGTNREPLVAMDGGALAEALAAAQRPERQPVLVHCLRGQRETGVLVGCMRQQQRWSLVATFDEYRRFAGSAASLLDLQTIELFGGASTPPPLPPLPPLPPQSPQSPRPPLPGGFLRFWPDWSSCWIR